MTMLQYRGSRPATSKVICDVIQEINDAVEKKLSRGVKELTTRVSGDTTWADCKLYCESEALSLPKPAIRFKVIDLVMRTDVMTFADDELSDFLDTIAGFMNIDMLSSVKLEPAQREARRLISGSPAYNKARGRLLTICDQVLPKEPSAAAAAAEEATEQGNSRVPCFARARRKPKLLGFARGRRRRHV